MSGINGELLALFEAERLREREQCIATIRAVADEVARSPQRNELSFDVIVDRIIERVRRQQ